MARNNFSSGVGSDSPFGVILPIEYPGSASAPILIAHMSKMQLPLLRTLGYVGS
jgi:hypothetical protein